MLLVNRLRKAVDHWRSEGYPGSSSVAQRLFTYWFDEDHLIGGEAWVTVQKARHVEINWIIETKGRVWDGTTAKEAAITD